MVVFDSLINNLTGFLYAYCVWDLSYFKHFQRLGVIHQCVLGDNIIKFFIRSGYVKIVKEMENAS